MDRPATYRLVATGVVLILLIAITASEWRHYNRFSSPVSVERQASEAVRHAAARFSQLSSEFREQALELSARLASDLESGVSAERMYERFTIAEHVWGAVLFADSTRIIWTGFAPDIPDSNLNEQCVISFRTQNNVRFLELSTIVYEDQGITYRLIIRRKISQENILSLGKDLELDPSSAYTPPNSYPVRFGFGGRLPATVMASEPLFLADSTRIGVVFASSDYISGYLETVNERQGIQRSAYVMILLVVIFLLLGGGMMVSSNGRSLVQLMIAAMGLYALTLAGMLNSDSVDHEWLALLGFSVHSFFFVIPALFIYRYRQPGLWNPDRFPALVPLFFAFLATLFTLAGIWWYFHQVTLLISETNLWLLDLQVIPSAPVVFFYAVSAIFFLAILASSLFAHRTLFSLNEPLKAYGLVGSVSGLLAGFLLFLAGGFDGHERLSLLFVVLSMASGYLLSVRMPAFFLSSRLRLFILFACITVAFSYAHYFQSHQTVLDERMRQAASEFSTDEEDEIRAITTSLLMDLNEAMSGAGTQTFNDLQFDRLVDSSIRPEWLRYSISVQVIDKDGDRFTDYTTSLAPPQWSTRFRIEELAFPFEDEQIRRDRLRPVFRSRPITTINARYSSFIRGWIPFYTNEETDEIGGWILCSVYRELPQLNRPLRTVVQAGPPDDWHQPMVVTEYRDGISRRTTIRGLPLNVPSPVVISPEVVQQMQADSLYFTESVSASETLRELYVLRDNGSVIRVARRQVDFNLQLFSFLRHFLMLSGYGVVILLLAILLGLNGAAGTGRLFKDRLIDRFIVAGFLCLILLTVASYTILDRLNSRDVRDELFERLETLVLNLESVREDPGLEAADLQDLVSDLNADATLFIDGKLYLTTTAQIFSQHVLPSTLSWPVYEQLSGQQRGRMVETADIDQQSMMIGYMPWYDQERRVAGIAAIPTFVKAPKFYDRLLSTTSYLLAFFTLIFGLLMVGVSLVARQLTAPIEELQRGLQKITEGELDAELNVPGNDEIGMLTRAYNLMASRLRSLQKELAEREREAAWKEMAQQVAHEIKNPLTPMKLSLQHLEQQLSATETDLHSMRPRIATITRNMIEQIDALSRIASDFSRFGQPQDQPRQSIDLRDLTRKVAAMYDTASGGTLRTVIPDSEVMISGVAEDLRRVLINLLKNAQEAIEEQGTITITLDKTKTEAHLLVEDTGKGIAEEDMDRIFLPRFSSKSSGSGLGLAISRKIVEEHGGTLSVTSKVGRGTIFQIIIPLREESQPGE